MMLYFVNPPFSPKNHYSRGRMSAIQLLRYVQVIVAINYIHLLSNTKIRIVELFAILDDTIDNK